MFRRGIPYFGLGPDGTPNAGLHFVSFQRSLREFNVVLNEWMMNPDFPASGTDVDELFARGLVTIEAAGFFFAPPADARFLGAGAFDPAGREPRPREFGRVLVRKKVVDASGQPTHADIDGIAFAVFDADDQQIGEEFETNPAGMATSDDLPVRVPLVLREIRHPDNLDPAPDQQFTLERRRQVLEMVNRLRPQQPGYGG